MNQPDPKLHQIISFFKSAVRIVAGLFLILNNYIAAGALFIIAEVLGVLEETV